VTLDRDIEVIILPVRGVCRACCSVVVATAGLNQSVLARQVCEERFVFRTVLAVEDFDALEPSAMRNSRTFDMGSSWRPNVRRIGCAIPACRRL